MVRFTRHRDMRRHLKLFPKLRAMIRQPGRAIRRRRLEAMASAAVFAGLVLRVKRRGVRAR